MALLLGGANVALAEESGGFVGIGIGGGDTELKIKVSGADNAEWLTSETSADKIKFSGIGYGFVVGYKQFFTPYLGLRYYANLDLHHNLTKFEELNESTDNYENKREDITLINYGVNVDFLGNFVVTDIADFGGFIGLGIGANTIKGKSSWIQSAKSGAAEIGGKFNDTAFDVWLNVGLRTNIATNHGVELVARVPFLPIKMIDLEVADGSYQYTFRQTYNILARYTFSF